jgi:epoxyqueuosine reductase QueG
VQQTDENRLITVCDSCKTAACWNGLFMCQSSQNAGTVDLPISELKTLNLEHPDYWNQQTYERTAR